MSGPRHPTPGPHEDVTKRRLARSLSLACILAAVGACVLLGLSSDRWRPPNVVRIESEKGLRSLLPEWATWISDAEDGRSQALLLRDGEFVVGEEFLFRYLASDRPTRHRVPRRGDRGDRLPRMAAG